MMNYALPIVMLKIWSKGFRASQEDVQDIESVSEFTTQTISKILKKLTLYD